MKRTLRELVNLARLEGVSGAHIQPGKPHPRLVGWVGSEIFDMGVSPTKGAQKPYVRVLIRKQAEQLRARSSAVERPPFKRDVDGSNPSERTISRETKP